MEAEGAGNTDGVGISFQEVVGADMVDALSLAFLNPHMAAAGAAAETPFPAAGRHLDQAQPGDGAGNVARLVVNAVMPAQEAGIVISHADVHHLNWLDSALLNQLVNKLTVVEHFVFAAELGILVAHGIEAMGADGHNLLDVVAVQGFDVLAGQHLEQILVAHPPRRVSGTGFLIAQDGKIHPGRLEHLNHRTGGALAALLQGGGAAHPEENFRIRLFGQGRYIQPLGPVSARVLGAAPGMTPLFHT